MGGGRIVRKLAAKGSWRRRKEVGGRRERAATRGARCHRYVMIFKHSWFKSFSCEHCGHGACSSTWPLVAARSRRRQLPYVAANFLFAANFLTILPARHLFATSFLLEIYRFNSQLFALCKSRLILIPN